MSPFTDAELRYLRSERLLGRIATVGADVTPHSAPPKIGAWDGLRDSALIERSSFGLASLWPLLLILLISEDPP